MSARRILLLGGTGVFGKRLARHLMTWEGIELFVSSRTRAKADRLARELTAGGGIAVHGVALDHRVSLTCRLKEIRPFVVIDCSGPFQSADHDTAEAILKAGAHLVDLADARDYLMQFGSRLDPLARARGLSALTGASSTPTLSACVVEELTAGWQRIDSIDICITPGGRSEVGRSVIEAILSYAGKDVPVWRAGRVTQTTGWRDARRVDVPGLGRRRVAAVETWDAEYLGPRHRVQSRVSFAAGLESRIEQRGIELIAALRKRHLLHDAAPLIPALLAARQLTRLPTSDRGSMMVDIRGIDGGGRFTKAVWSLVARRDHGPFVPTLPAAAALAKLLRGGVTPGAGLAHLQLSLSDIQDQMAPYDIETKTFVEQPEEGLFERCLGAIEFAGVPEAVRAFHRTSAPVMWTGSAQIDGGRWFLPKLLARAFGLPSTGRDVPLTVQVERGLSKDGTPVERWTRHFGGQRMTSELACRRRGILTERFGPFTFCLGLETGHAGIRMPVTGWKLGPLPLPRCLAPRSQTREFQDDAGRFRFDVRLSVPILGLLAHYRGQLEPRPPRPDPRG